MVNWASHSNCVSACPVVPRGTKRFDSQVYLMVKTASRVLNHHHLWPSNTSRLIFSKRSVVCWCDHWLTWRRFHLPRQQPIDHLRAAFFTSSIRERGVQCIPMSTAPTDPTGFISLLTNSKDLSLCKSIFRLSICRRKCLLPSWLITTNSPRWAHQRRASARTCPYVCSSTASRKSPCDHESA